MLKKILAQIGGAIAGIWLAVTFVPGAHIELLGDSAFFGISLTAVWQVFIILGIILGLLNFFVKPILNLITLPLRILTLGLFGFVINMGLLWVVDVMFREFSAPLFYPLFLTSLIIWAISTVASTIFRNNRNNE